MPTDAHHMHNDSGHAEQSATHPVLHQTGRGLLRSEFLVPAIVFLAQAIWLFDFSIDDASVSFRYAKHLADGFGLRWNTAGPPVEGYSNFLWVLILALGRVVGFDIEFLAHALGLLLGLVNLFILYRLSLRLWPAGKFTWAPMLLVAVCPVWVMWVMSGLEIAVFGFFLLLTMLGLAVSPRAKPWLLTVGLAGLALTRPEGIALAPIPLVAGWIADRREPLRARWRCYGVPMIVLVGISAALLTFRLVYFGYPLANTVYAKFSMTMPSAAEVGKWLVFALPFLTAWLFAARYRALLPYPAVLAAGLGLVVWQMVLVLPVKPVMFFLHRYHIAFLPLLALVVPFVLARVAQKKKSAAVMLMLALVLWTAQGLPAVVKRRQSELYAIQRQRCVVESLLSLPGTVTVALIDAGRIPYWSELPASDIWGLCDAEIAHRGFTYESTLGRNPDVYVMSLNITNGEVYPRLGFDIMVSGNPTFQQKFRLWRICAGTPPTIEWYYDYGIFINTEWAARQGLIIQETSRP